MTKYLKYIFIYFSCYYFILAGVGFNVVSYCCNVCANEGIESVASDSCVAVHKQIHPSQNQSHEDVSCDDLNHHPENCHLFRVNTDTPVSQVSSQLLIKQILAAKLIVQTFVFANEAVINHLKINIPPPNLGLLQSGRSILALNATFLI